MFLGPTACVKRSISPTQFFLKWCNSAQIKAQLQHINVVFIILFYTEWAEVQSLTAASRQTRDIVNLSF